MAEHRGSQEAEYAHTLLLNMAGDERAVDYSRIVEDPFSACPEALRQKDPPG
jgi:hypothetical protein